MKIILIILLLGLLSCTHKVIVKDCKTIVADYLECELVK
jgi:hypothetical protein